ncbi:MAG: hypothetical protein WCO43_10500 [Chitinophagia bacterium]|jgi:hypothetical protein
MNNQAPTDMGPAELDNELLSKFILGKATEAEIAQLQEAAAGSPSLQDALEGLQNFEHTADIQTLTQQINQQLGVYTQKKKPTRIKKRRTDNFWPIVSVLVVITLSLLAFVLIRFYFPHK